MHSKKQWKRKKNLGKYAWSSPGNNSAKLTGSLLVSMVNYIEIKISQFSDKLNLFVKSVWNWTITAEGSSLKEIKNSNHLHRRNVKDYRKNFFFKHLFAAKPQIKSFLVWHDNWQHRNKTFIFPTIPFEVSLLLVK